MKINKSSIAALEISEELKADLLELFGMVETKQNEVEELRKKVPTDSQKVVESVDFDKFTAATTELEKLKTELAEKLKNQPSEVRETTLSAFAPFFE